MAGKEQGNSENLTFWGVFEDYLEPNSYLESDTWNNPDLVQASPKFVEGEEEGL